MKVKDLIEQLKTFDPELDVIYAYHSDYSPLDAEDLTVIEIVPKDFYYMRVHPTMSDENKAKVTKCLRFPGN